MINTSIDTSLLQDYIDGTGDETIVTTLIGYFKENVPPKIDLCFTYLNPRDDKKICQQLHSLKNSFSNVGALGVAKYLQDIETDIKSINDQSLHEALVELSSTHKTVMKNLSDIYST